MNAIIRTFENRNLYTSRIAIARIFLALNGLLTLAFNNIGDLSNGVILGADKVTTTQSFTLRDYTIFAAFGFTWGKILGIIILLFVFTGYWPRISILLQAWVHLSLCNSLFLVEGGDQVASNLSLLLIPFCFADTRKNQWAAPKPNTGRQRQINVFANTYYILISLQVAIIYLHASVGKFFKSDWLDGTCMYYWVNNNVFGVSKFFQPLFSWITLSRFAPLITWSVMFLEIGLFACILATNKRIRKFFLISAIFFHFAILFVHGLVTFFFAMLGALILYLDEDNYVHKQFIKLKYLVRGVKV